MTSPVKAPIGSTFEARACLMCQVATTKARCPICQRKTAPVVFEKIGADRAESDTGLTFAIWPFEAVRPITPPPRWGRSSPPRRRYN